MSESVKQKKLAVIILNWNGLNILKEFLPKVAETTRGDAVDLIVADNGSDDGSAQWVAENYPDIKLLRFSENFGFSEGYNRAIRATAYPYTLLLNSDVATPEGWWQPLLDFMEKNPDVGAAQPKIMSYRQPEKFEYAGAAGGLIDRLGYPYCRGRVFDSIETDHGQYDSAPADIAWASGAALMVRSALYIKLGGLDPKFFAHMEEIDLCCRIHGAGYRVCVVPGSKVFHLGGGSLPYGNPRKTYLNFRNNLLLLHKNLPRGRGRFILFTRRLADTLAFGLFLVKGQWDDARAVLKAHRDFRHMRRQYNSLPHRDTMRSLPGADRFIVLSHFLKRKKKL